MQSQPTYGTVKSIGNVLQTRPKAPSLDLIAQEVKPTLELIKTGVETKNLNELRIDRIARTLGQLADFLLSQGKAVETIGGFAIATVRDGRTGVMVSGLGLARDGSMSIETHRLARQHAPEICRAVTLNRDQLQLGIGVAAEITRPSARSANPEKSLARMSNQSHLKQVLAQACLTVAGIAGERPHESLFGSHHLLNRIANTTEPATLFYTEPLASALAERLPGQSAYPDSSTSSDYVWRQVDA